MAKKVTTYYRGLGLYPTIVETSDLLKAADIGEIILFLKDFYRLLQLFNY